MFLPRLPPHLNVDGYLAHCQGGALGPTDKVDFTCCSARWRLTALFCQQSTFGRFRFFKIIKKITAFCTVAAFMWTYSCDNSFRRLSVFLSFACVFEQYALLPHSWLIKYIDSIAFFCTSRLQKGNLSCSQVLIALQALHLSSSLTWPGEANFQTVSDPFFRQGGADAGNLESFSASIQVDLYDNDKNNGSMNEWMNEGFTSKEWSLNIWSASLDNLLVLFQDGVVVGAGLSTLQLFSH